MRVAGSSRARHENDTHHRINSTKKAPRRGAISIKMVAEGGLFPAYFYSFDAIRIIGFSMHGTPILVLSGTTMLLCFYDFLRFLDLTFHYSLIFVFFVNILCSSSPIDNLPKRIDLSNNRTTSGTNSDNF